MTVAVVIPTWNTPTDWLWRAIRSAAENDPAECIVIDDGSSPPVALPSPPHWRLTTMRIAHAGVGAARNAGNRATSADLICVLDADDLMLPGRIRTQAQYLAAHPGVDVVSGQMDYTDRTGKLIGQPRTAPFVGRRYDGRVPHGASMYRRSLWERVGGYPENVRRGVDWRFFIRCETAGCTFGVLPDVFIRRRIHPGSLSFAKSRHLQTWLRKVKGLER